MAGGKQELVDEAGEDKIGSYGVWAWRTLNLKISLTQAHGIYFSFSLKFGRTLHKMDRILHFFPPWIRNRNLYFPHLFDLGSGLPDFSLSNQIHF